MATPWITQYSSFVQLLRFLIFSTVFLEHMSKLWSYKSYRMWTLLMGPWPINSELFIMCCACCAGFVGFEPQSVSQLVSQSVSQSPTSLLSYLLTVVSQSVFWNKLLQPSEVCFGVGYQKLPWMRGRYWPCLATLIVTIFSKNGFLLAIGCIRDRFLTSSHRVGPERN